MVKLEHIDILKRGANAWNKWAEENDLFELDLTEANLSGLDLRGVDLSGVCLGEAELNETDLSGALLIHTDLSGAEIGAAKLRGAKLNWTNLSEANLSGANLRGAQIIAANLNEAILHRANLTRANLGGANLVKANLTEAILQDCAIYGIAAWDINLEGATQRNLIITPPDQARITIVNLKVAQFIYLILNNKEIRDTINTITSKVILILGRFVDERKKVLDALKDELRKQNYVPVLFDFDKPSSRDVTETVTTLARMARFIIADISDPKSIPQELAFIVPHLPSVPVQPIILSSQREYGMFEHFTRYPWILPIYHYKDQASLLQSLKERVIGPAEEKAQELTKG